MHICFSESTQVANVVYANMSYIYIYLDTDILYIVVVYYILYIFAFMLVNCKYLHLVEVRQGT